MLVAKNCIACNKEFHVERSQLNHGRGRCCSRECAASLAAKNRNDNGPSNNNWRGGVARKGSAEYIRKYRSENPEKHSAHIAMQKALRSGVLMRAACEICGNDKTDAHHDDYSKPLDVRWLCKKHHMEFHAKQRKI